MQRFEAVILAAGSGRRLGTLGESKPKGLLEIGGRTLVGRSIQTLRYSGVRRVTIVTGFGAEQYRKSFAKDDETHLVYNQNFATCGSFGSMALGLRETSRDVIVLDSDILFQPVGLQSLLASADEDCVLASGLTGSGDEVWVEATADRLTRLSKVRRREYYLAGEFVGISRLSQRLVASLLDGLERNPSVLEAMEYEAVLTRAAQSWRIGVQLVESLIWGEVDTIEQLRRLEKLFGNQSDH